MARLSLIVLFVTIRNVRRDTIASIASAAEEEDEVEEVSQIFLISSDSIVLYSYSISQVVQMDLFLLQHHPPVELRNPTVRFATTLNVHLATSAQPTVSAAPAALPQVNKVHYSSSQMQSPLIVCLHSLSLFTHLNFFS